MKITLLDSTCQSVPASLLERITTTAPMLSSCGSGFSRAAHLPEALPVGRVLAGQPLRFHGRLGCSPDLRISAARGSETILAMKKRKDLKKISTYGREESGIHKMGLASLIWTLFLLLFWPQLSPSRAGCCAPPRPRAACAPREAPSFAPHSGRPRPRVGTDGKASARESVSPFQKFIKPILVPSFFCSGGFDGAPAIEFRTAPRRGLGEARTASRYPFQLLVRAREVQRRLGFLRPRDLSIILFSCVPVCIVGLRQGHFETSLLDCTNEKRRCSESFKNYFFCAFVN